VKVYRDDLPQCSDEAMYLCILVRGTPGLFIERVRLGEGLSH
jgi:hypothetical protein